MGVKDLWKLLETTGRPVTLESLEGLVLAIGESISTDNYLKFRLSVWGVEAGQISHLGDRVQIKPFQ